MNPKIIIQGLVATVLIFVVYLCIQNSDIGKNNVDVQLIETPSLTTTTADSATPMATVIALPYGYGRVEAEMIVVLKGTSVNADALTVMARRDFVYVQACQVIGNETWLTVLYPVKADGYDAEHHVFDLRPGFAMAQKGSDVYIKFGDHPATPGTYVMDNQCDWK